MLVADASSAVLPPPCTTPVVSIELKPKCGTRSRSPFLAGSRGLRWAISPFRVRHWKRCILAAKGGEEAPWGRFTDSEYNPEDFFAAEAPDDSAEPPASVEARVEGSALSTGGPGAGHAPRLARALRALLRSPQNNMQVCVGTERVFGMEPGGAAATARLDDRLAAAWRLPSPAAGSLTLLQLLHAILVVSRTMKLSPVPSVIRG